MEALYEKCMLPDSEPSPVPDWWLEPEEDEPEGALTFKDFSDLMLEILEVKQSRHSTRYDSITRVNMCLPLVPVGPTMIIS